MGKIAISLITGAVFPILGGIVFFGFDSIAGGAVPAQRGVGAALAAQWPAQILTPIIPPFFPGKIVYTWTELAVDQTGVETLGTFALADRSPRANLRGPRDVTILQNIGHARVKYDVSTRDLRNPTIRWSGAASGAGLNKTIRFETAGKIDLKIEASDSDGLSASHRRRVNVKVVKLQT